MIRKFIDRTCIVVAWTGICLYMFLQILPPILVFLTGKDPKPMPTDLDSLAIICLIVLVAGKKEKGE